MRGRLSKLTCNMRSPRQRSHWFSTSNLLQSSWHSEPPAGPSRQAGSQQTWLPLWSKTHWEKQKETNSKLWL